MAEFDLNAFVADLRKAATGDQPERAVSALMKQAFTDPAAIVTAMPEYPGEDVVLFEDETVSIWQCRFQPHVHAPPHDHQTTATIGVYQGAESNRFYVCENDRLVHKSTRRLAAGDVISIGPRAIHSVSADGDEPSFAIHVYLAALTRIERSLFDWKTGEACPFTDENYERLARTVDS